MPLTYEPDRGTKAGPGKRKLLEGMVICLLVMLSGAADARPEDADGRGFYIGAGVGTASHG